MSDRSESSISLFRRIWLAYWMIAGAMVGVFLLLSKLSDPSFIMFPPLIWWTLLGWIVELLAALILFARADLREELRWFDAAALILATAGRWFCFDEWFMIAQAM